VGGNLRDTQGAIRASHEGAVPAILRRQRVQPSGCLEGDTNARRFGSSKPSAPSPGADFTVEDYGSVIFVRCQNEPARKALENFGEPNSPWFGNALAVESRFGGLVSSLREDGWKVQ
jgi:hypothetical protein